MRAMFGMMIMPFELLWSLLERRIWISIIVLSVVAAVAIWMKAFLTACAVVAVVAILFMRIDALAAKPAAAPADAE